MFRPSHFEQDSLVALPCSGRLTLNRIVSLLGHVPAVPWKESRSQLTPALTSSRIRGMIPFMLEVCKDLKNYLDREISKGPLEAKDVAARYTTDNLASCEFGIHGRALSDEDDTIFSKEFHKFFKKFVTEAVSKREISGVTRNDFLQILLQLKQKGEIDSEENSNENDHKRKFVCESSDKAIGKHKLHTGSYVLSDTTNQRHPFREDLHQRASEAENSLKSKVEQNINTLMSISGYKYVSYINDNKEFIIKELSILSVCSTLRWVLRYPSTIEELTTLAENQANYIINKLHGIPWDSDDVDNSLIYSLISRAKLRAKAVYVKGEAYSEQSLLSHAATLFVEGYETSSIVMSYTLFELAVNPDIQERVRAEIEESKGEMTLETISKMSYLDKVLSGKQGLACNKLTYLDKFLSDKQGLACNKLTYLDKVLSDKQGLACNKLTYLDKDRCPPCLLVPPKKSHHATAHSETTCYN
uniref:Cytochrome P450 n=1 Tax=Timema monikensis TaxID=170555 RepID=A0A7R9EDQ6_9NEOP|nr:unnamed protein product [Timema monikensis]